MKQHSSKFVQERPLRVLHVISSLDLRAGGPAAALGGLAPAQRAAGTDVRILYTWRQTDDLSLADRLKESGITMYGVGPSVGPLGRHRYLTSTARDALSGSDIVHIHALWEEVQHQAAVAARRGGVPYIFRPCGMLDPWSLRHSRWKKRLYMAWRLRRDLQGAAAIHYTTELERDLACPLRLRPAAIVEPNGVDLSEFAALPSPGTFRARYPQIGRRQVALFLGRLHPKKGLDLLIPAFAQGAPADAVLVIAGPDDPQRPYRSEVEQMVRQRRLEHRTIFTGMLKGADRISALADADVFVLPSYQENFGIAVVEALAAGTPVIVSDQVNIHGEVAAAGVGEVIPAAVAPLARGLRRWLDDESLRIAAAQKARPFVQSRYDWQLIARRWATRYLQHTAA